ncbi:2-C-methyl-D-erythritol 4-phosphate cytidylyltransferase [Faecalicatena contorta]|uniref:IspD/TarI family cytidylyltransferase n=1 Tax=Faecalicatena contorta TaxID=39482 RepID=UPI001F1F2970|nr:2-C-methyl-D-erythritol 4-phosphate cytidylyltransferase [Faecalicatena contorta]MCF2555212.1 2-C-methyl-D-erythritol 4-phosphate cytidylyltransferase [Faecalicatena contorta]MCF2680726.1 2-C-methyl-D-erythritol 4-phosphate cytidylyltransferase [Faecalicatena contorta]
MIFAGILAGGIGSRMNMADMPKQFLNLGDKPMVIHTLEKFLLCPRIDHVYIGVHPNWDVHMEDIIEKYVKVRKECVHVVSGGADRNGTIMNIIDAIEEQFGHSNDNYIVTHDSVRPFISSRIINDNIDSVLEYKACDTVIPATDTIVASEDGVVISDIPRRDKLYQGQTPQSFQIDLLKTLYNNLSEEEKSILTDACKIAVMQNQPVHLVKGEPSNLKITTISDYKIAQAMLGGKTID